MNILLNLLNFVVLFELVDARGSMLEPPQRSSLWRIRPWKKDKTIPKNLEDYGLNCGGFWRLHGINKGQCGVCGDPYDAVSRLNEAGGKYANEIIVRRYRQHRKFINVTIDITSNIGGYFEFRLCPKLNVSDVVTQECLDKHRLKIHDHGLNFYPKDDKKYKLALDMPENITCKHCVLQWKWRGSYNWGRCNDGYQDVGCGNQEEYYNCADIAILPSNRRKPPKPQTKKPTPSTTTIATPINQWEQIMNKDIVENTIQTIPTQKDVKTMIKDINDIKSINNIYDPSFNLVNMGDQVRTGISGIPIYVLPSVSGSYLPTFSPLPSIIPAFQDRVLGDFLKPEVTMPPIPVKPVSLPPPPVKNDDQTSKIIKDSQQNSIFDFTSGNIIHGIRQDLVQPPGDDIFNKVGWIEGTVPASSGLGLQNASGVGNASASTATTNQLNKTLINNTSLNTNDIGIPIPTEASTTLDPLTLLKNSNMLNDMFYGAVATGLEPELENLLPFSLFQNNLFGDMPQHAFTDTPDQFIRSLYDLNQQNYLNLTAHQMTGVASNKSPTLVPSSKPSVGQSVGTGTGISDDVIPMNEQRIVKQTRDPNPTSSTTNRASTPIQTTPTVEKTTDSNLNKQIFNPISTNSKANIAQTESLLDPYTDVLVQMNNMINNLYNQFGMIVHGGNGQAHIDPIAIQSGNSQPPITIQNGNKQILNKPIAFRNGNTQALTEPNTIQTGKKQFSPEPITTSVPSVITKTTPVQQQKVSNEINVRRSLNKLPATTDGDGVVVAEINKLANEILEQNNRDASLVRKFLGLSGNKAGNIVATDLASNYINHNMQQAASRKDIVSETNGVSQNSPIVISDPKTKFSFRNLDARNVEIVDEPFKTKSVDQNQSKQTASKSTDESANQSSVISNVPKKNIDVTYTTLSKSGDFSQKILSQNIANQNANAMLFEKMLGRLNSGILISNSNAKRSTENKKNVMPVSKSSMKTALQTLYLGETTTNNNMKRTSLRKPKTTNVWDIMKGIKIHQNNPDPLPTQVVPFNSVYHSFLDNGLLVHRDPPRLTSIAPSVKSFNTATNSLLDMMNLWNTQTTISPYQGSALA